MSFSDVNYEKDDQFHQYKYVNHNGKTCALDLPKCRPLQPHCFPEVIYSLAEENRRLKNIMETMEEKIKSLEERIEFKEDNLYDRLITELKVFADDQIDQDVYHAVKNAVGTAVDDAIPEALRELSFYSDRYLPDARAEVRSELQAELRMEMEQRFLEIKTNTMTID